MVVILMYTSFFFLLTLYKDIPTPHFTSFLAALIKYLLQNRYGGSANRDDQYFLRSNGDHLPRYVAYHNLEDDRSTCRSVGTNRASRCTALKLPSELLQRQNISKPSPGKLEIEGRNNF